MNRTKKQHYIPQFWLKNFRIPGEEHLWVFDKRSERKYQSSIRDVASERYYYDSKIGDSVVSFESRLAKIEEEAAPAFADLIATEGVRHMTPENQAAITVFLTTQMVRGKAWRTGMSQTYDLVCEKLGGKERAELAGLPPPDEDVEKFVQMRDLPKTIKDYSPALLNKIWILQKTSAHQKLVIGDEPIVRQNSMPSDGIAGNTGLACLGVEIYLPLSPRLVLALLCPSLLPVVEYGAKHASTTLRAIECERLLNAMETGRPYLLAQPELTRLNALQIVHSERFIMSCNSNFEQIERLMKRRPELREVPRYVH